MRILRVNRESRLNRRQRLLEARRRHLLFEAKKRRKMNEEYSIEPKARGYSDAKPMGKNKDWGNADVGMTDAKPNRKVIPALGEARKRSLSERRRRINEMRQRRIRLEARSKRLHESQREDVRTSRTSLREARFLEWLERRERRKLMEARTRLRREARREKIEECNECGEEEERPVLRSRASRRMRPMEARKLREARLQLIRKSLAEARARKLKESAADAVDTLGPTEPKNPVQGDDLQEEKDGLEKAKKLGGPDAPHKEEKAKEVKDAKTNLTDEKGEPTAVSESKKPKDVKKGLKESQAYINRKARLQKYLKEHMR